MKRLLLSTLLGSGLIASGNAKESESTKESMKKECEKQSYGCHSCLEYAASLLEVDDNTGPGFGIRGDVLYMNYTVPTLSFISEITLSRNNTHEDSHIVGPTAKANVGCEIGLSYRMCNNPGYTFDAAWYHIVSEHSKSVSGNLTPAHIVAINLAAPGTGSNNASLTINFWDLVLRKDYCWGDRFTISPAVGVIGGFMDIKNKAHFKRTGGSWGTGVVATDIHFDQDLKYEGIGARFGSNFEYKIWKGVKLVGNFYFNALYGLSKDNLKINANGTIFNGLSSADARYSTHQGRTFFDSLLGVAWGSTWCKNALWTELHAGWKYQYFSMGWTQFEAELNNAVRQLPLYGQGLQAGLSLKY